MLSFQAVSSKRTGAYTAPGASQPSVRPGRVDEEGWERASGWEDGPLRAAAGPSQRSGPSKNLLPWTVSGPWPVLIKDFGGQRLSMEV